MDTVAPPGQLMGIREIVDQSFDLYRRNAVRLVGILEIVLIPQAIVSLVAPAFSLIFSFAQAVTYGALIAAISARYHRRRITIGEAYSAFRWISLVAASIAETVLVLIGLVLLIIPGVYLLVRWVFIAQAIVLEGMGIAKAFSRSAALVRGNWWHVFKVGAVVTVVGIAPALVVGGFSLWALPARWRDAVTTVLVPLVWPFIVGAQTLLYYDLRLRVEGSKGEATAAVRSGDSPASP